MKGELDRTIMVYVDSYQDGVPVGRFHIASQEEARPFRSLSQLLIDINHNLDQENFPQSFSAMRKFRAPLKQTELSQTPITQNKGEKATFLIRILFRQNASWQGAVTWVEGNQEEYFRSVLELIVLMDHALGYNEET